MYNLYEHQKSASAYVYYYAKKDHLGSTRVLCHEANGVMKADQVTDYYPFGVLHHNNGTNVNRYLFSGKELQDQTVNGKMLQLYDFGARNYDPVLGRWFNIDPLAAKYYAVSPYVYCGNDPINRVDPDGRDWYEYKDRDGNHQTMWSKSQEQFHKDDSGNVWNNIGENYSYNVGNITYTFNQSNVESIDFTTNTQFQAQTTGTGCKIAADNMTRSSGADPSPGRTGELLMANHNANGVATTPTSQSAEGIDRINSAIENGYAITIGIDYKSEQQHNFAPNGDGMTDHFITAVGKTVNTKTGNTTYRFYDPGSRANGNNSSNRMSLQGGFLQGKLSFGKRPIFKVTTVRKNR